MTELVWDRCCRIRSTTMRKPVHDWVDNTTYFLCSLHDVDVTRTAPTVSMTSAIVVCDRGVLGT